MRAPSEVLVLDAAILISAALGRSLSAIIEAGQYAKLVTTERVRDEVNRRIELGMKRKDLLALVSSILESVTIVPMAQLASLLPDAERTLKDAVASRNGSISDAHVLALAWSVGADVWTTDRDFAGTGVATWSTPNLMRALGYITPG